MGTSDFARDVFETELSKYEAYGGRRRGLAAHRHSHTALRIHQHCNRRFGHFARTVPRGLGRGEGYGDTVVTFLERADNATLDVAAEILGLPAASLPCNTRSERCLPICFGGMEVGDLVALADATHVGSVGLAMGYVIRFLTTQDARVRGDSHDGADHVWAVSDCYDHNGAPHAWFTGRKRRRQRIHVVVRTRFVVEALRCRVRFSCSRRIRTLDNHSLSDASPAMSNGGSRRLRSRSPIKQRVDCSIP
jgi:hypothetical protein